MRKAKRPSFKDLVKRFEDERVDFIKQFQKKPDDKATVRQTCLAGAIDVLFDGDIPEDARHLPLDSYLAQCKRYEKMQGINPKQALILTILDMAKDNCEWSLPTINEVINGAICKYYDMTNEDWRVG